MSLLDAEVEKRQAEILSPALLRRVLYRPVRPDYAMQQESVPLYCIAAQRFLIGRDFKRGATTVADMTPDARNVWMDMVNSASIMAGNKPNFAGRGGHTLGTQHTRLIGHPIFTSERPTVPIGMQYYLLASMGLPAELADASERAARGQKPLAAKKPAKTRGRARKPSESVMISEAEEADGSEEEEEEDAEGEEEEEGEAASPPGPTPGELLLEEVFAPLPVAAPVVAPVAPTVATTRKRRATSKGQPRPSKRVRPEGEADALPTHQPTHGEGEGEEAAEPAPAPRAHWLSILQRIKASEALYVMTRRDKLAQGLKAKLARVLPPIYSSYLNMGEARAIYRKFIESNYTDAERRRLQGHVAALVHDPEQPEVIYQQAHQEALSFVASIMETRRENIDPAALAIATYYPAHFTMGRDVQAHPELLQQPCAPAPLQFPCDMRHVLELSNYYLFPELHYDAPLPFPIGVELGEDSFYERNVELFLSQHAERLFHPILQSYLSAYRPTASVVDDALAEEENRMRGAANMEGVRAFIDAVTGQEKARSAVLLHEMVSHPTTIAKIADIYRRLIKDVEKSLQGKRHDLHHGLGYPGWLSLGGNAGILAAGVAVRDQVREILLLNTVDGRGGDDDDIPMRPMDPAALAQRFMELAPGEGLVPPTIHPPMVNGNQENQNPLLGLAMAAEEAATMGQHDPELIGCTNGHVPPIYDAESSKAMSERLRREAGEKKILAGKWNVPETVLDTGCDILCLRVIAEAKRAALEREISAKEEEIKHAPPDVLIGMQQEFRDARDQRRQLLVQELGHDTLRVFVNTRVESAAFIKQRNSIATLVKQRGNLIIPAQPIVNGSVFQTMICYQQHTLAIPFKIAPNTLKLALILITALDCRHLLQPFGEGCPMPCVLVHGDPMTSKSFAAWMAYMVTLAGGASNETHVSEKALTGGGHLGYEAHIYHEANPSMLCDPSDENNKAKAGNSTIVAMLKTAITDQVRGTPLIAHHPPHGERKHRR